MLKRQRPPNVSEALARGRYFDLSEMSLVDHAELPSSRPEHQTNAYTQRSVPTLARPQRVTAGMWACRPDRAMPSSGAQSATVAQQARSINGAAGAWLHARKNSAEAGLSRV